MGSTRPVLATRAVCIVAGAALVSISLPAPSSAIHSEDPKLPTPRHISTGLPPELLDYSPLEEARRAPLPLSVTPSLGRRNPPPISPGPDVALAAGTPMSLRARLVHETPREHGPFAPLPSAGPEAFVRVHAYGAVVAMADAGRPLWYRSATSHYADWGIESRAVPLVLVGSAPSSPLALVSENPFAVGDVTGDGHDDVVVAHYVFSPAALKGSYATLLDGLTGVTLWWQRFEGFLTHVVAADLDPSPGAEVILAREPPDGPSVLVALDLEPEPSTDALEARTLWRSEAGPAGTRFLHVDRVSADPARIAASWSARDLGAPSPKGSLTLLDASGNQVWFLPTGGWVRTFRSDPAGGALVVQEMVDPIDPVTKVQTWRYRISALSLADGSSLASTWREGALMLSLGVGDADGDGETEWAVAEIALTLGIPFVAPPRWVLTRVALLEQDAGPRWIYEASSDADREMPRALEIIGGPRPAVIVAVSRVLEDVPAGYADWSDSLFAIAGDSEGAASILWRTDNGGLSPLFLLPIEAAGRTAVLLGTEGFGGAALDAETGARLAGLPVLAEPTSVEALDVDGDGDLDLLVGGRSGVVAAMDVSGGSSGPPPTLWATAVDGPVHDLALGDLDGDGRVEVVVAASREVAALRASDGHLLWTHRRPASRMAELYWTVGVGDVDGDRAHDVIVPGQRLLALRGSNGALLWEYEPQGGGGPSNFSTVALADVNGDGAADVGAEFTMDPPYTLAPRHVIGFVVVDGRAGTPLWVRRAAAPGGRAVLWRSAVTYEAPGGPRFAFASIQDHSLGAPTDRVPRPRLDVFEGASGESAWTSDKLPRGESPSVLLTHSPRGGDELVDFNWYGISRGTPEEVAETETTKTILDATFARLRSGEDYVIVGGKQGDGRISLEVYPAGVVWSGGGPDPGPVASWGGASGLAVDAPRVVDLDGDGVDEIVALPFDLEGWRRVAQLEGVTVSGGADVRPHGFAILEADG